MKLVLKTFPPALTLDYHPDNHFNTYGEDLYFTVGLLKLKSLGYLTKIGLDEFATKFCTHTHFIHKTFCVHKLDNYTTPNQLQIFLEYCPIFINFIKTN